MIESKDFFRLLTISGGYYQCPMRSGQRLGPLVGYAKRDESGRQYVGDIYADCSVLERTPDQLRQLLVHVEMSMEERANEDDGFLFPDCAMGMPMGGLASALILAQLINERSGENGCEFMFPEIEMTPSENVGEKPKKTLVFGRHAPEEGARVVLVEDVCNAFSTTEDAIHLVESARGSVVGIACLLNRSSNHDKVFTLPNGHRIPIFAVAYQAIPSYPQDHPAVKEDVDRGNVIWEPKKHRAELQRAMMEGSLR